MNLFDYLTTSKHPLSAAALRPWSALYGAYLQAGGMQPRGLANLAGPEGVRLQAKGTRRAVPHNLRAVKRAPYGGVIRSIFQDAYDAGEAAGWRGPSVLVNRDLDAKKPLWSRVKGGAR